jgi:hypothetical protein
MKRSVTEICEVIYDYLKEKGDDEIVMSTFCSSVARIYHMQEKTCMSKGHAYHQAKRFLKERCLVEQELYRDTVTTMYVPIKVKNTVKYDTVYRII